MAVEANLRNKTLYKLEIGFIKYLPFVIAIFYFINTFCSLFEINFIFLSYFAGLSVFPWLFIFISSFVFKFCNYHRIPLYYVLVNDLINILDSKIEIPLNNLWYMSLHSSLFFVAFLLVLLLRKKCKNQC